MSALKKSSNGHDWKKASPEEQNDFCRDQLVIAPLTTLLLHDALAILYRTDKKPICDTSLGNAVALIAATKAKPAKS